MTTWNRSDIWADADARNIRRAAVWKLTIMMGVLLSWLTLTVARSWWDVVSCLEPLQHMP
jgi:hypothetical protein